MKWIQETNNIRKMFMAALAAIMLLYLGQGVIYWLRLNQIDAAKVTLTLTSESCDEINCTASWRLTPSGKFLLLGHILRTHRVHLENSDENLVPVSMVRGTSADSWASLRIYRVEPNKTYVLEASKYKSIRMGYFIGILPRTTNHEGILGIPDIGPSISSMSGLLGVILLIITFSAAHIGQNSNAASRGREHQLLKILMIAAGFASLASFISMGALDSLLTEGDLRNKILRISLICAIFIPVAAHSDWMHKSHLTLKTMAIAIGISGVGLIFWPQIRGGAGWAIVVTSFTLIGCISLLRFGKTVSSIVLSLSLFDALKIFGLIDIGDYPPVYISNVSIISSMILLAGDLGGYATISMAGLAYRRFKRDLVLSAIQQLLKNSGEDSTSSRISELRLVLADISTLTGAGIVSITINLPLGRPITQSYNASTGNTQIFDDGRIPGAVTLRALLYGDEAMFESFIEFASRLKLPRNPALQDSSYFCSVPLRVNRSIIGSIILTKFNDGFIHKQRSSRSEPSLLEERETIHLVAERISQSLSKLMVQDLDSSAILSKSLHTAVHRVIGSSVGTEDFLLRFAAAISKTCKVGVMIHEQLKDQGVALTQCEVPKDGWQVFIDSPLNLRTDASASYGPTVVAFRENKSSYVKDVKEIMERLHPKTQGLLVSMGIKSLAAVPLRASERNFVVTVMTTSTEKSVDPAITSIIESTEALFVAAIEVMSQKTSVLALGQLASRLIGDDEVREKILDAARSKDLPTTIGSPRVSFLLLFDLVGSSDLSSDNEVKARAYGDFYDAVNHKSQEILGGTIRKTIGDAVIVTWDGTAVSLAHNYDLLKDLESVATYADQIARSIGCKGARALLHHGRYFLGLVGTQTFGQIDVIGSGIDEVCKMEGIMKSLSLSHVLAKLAISDTAAAELAAISDDKYLAHGYIDVSKLCSQNLVLKFAKALADPAESQVSDAA